MRTTRDIEAADNWATLNKIRKQKISVKDKILAYLRHKLGKPVTGEELRYLADDATGQARRRWRNRSAPPRGRR
jgi:hypothetical protein